MANFRTLKTSKNQGNIYSSGHELARVQNSHINATAGMQTTPFHQLNASKFSVNNVEQSNHEFYNTFNPSRNSALRTPFEASSSVVNNASYQLRSQPELQSNNLQSIPRFPFPGNQQQYVGAKISTSAPSSSMLSQNLATAYHTRFPNLHDLNNRPPAQVRPINSSGNSIADKPMENSHGHLDQNTNWHINLPYNVPPPSMLTRPPMTAGSTLVADNSSTNFNNVSKPFSVSHITPHQNGQLSIKSPLNFPPVTSNNFSLPPFISPILPSACVQSSNAMNSLSINPTQSEKERLLSSFLDKFHPKQKSQIAKKSDLTVVEFRSALKIAFSLLKLLSETKDNLMKLLKSDEDKWKSHAKNALQLQHQLIEVCNMLCNPNNLRHIQNRLLIIKKKREYKNRRKLTLLSLKQEKEKNRKELNQEIDKWFDNIKEKNLDLKRKIEMKKEADNILSEVRRKIHEAKRTIEKLKTFEKLRAARQANATRKSLFIQPEHNKKFEEKVSVLKKVMSNQLSDYEAEERALKVMLETEQEEQLEQEALWRIKKMKTILQRKQKNIKECLFGDSDEPTPADPIYLFYSHHTSANSSISSLLQIRHQWDVYLANDGESIPQQWVVPVPPNSSVWEKFCSS